jgi:hypothetical protein
MSGGLRPRSDTPKPQNLRAPSAERPIEAGQGQVTFGPQHLHQLAELGIQVAHGTVVGVDSLHPLDLMAERVIPAIEMF